MGVGDILTSFSCPSTLITMNLSLPLLLLLATLTYAEALKCLTCDSINGNNKDCEKGSTSTSQACSDQDTGCMVSLTKAVGQTVWNRMCCMDPLCLDTDVAAGDIGVWIQSCDTDDCNTMDPSSGHTLGIMIGLNTLLVICTRII